MNTNREARTDTEIPARFAASAFANLYAADLLTGSIQATTSLTSRTHLGVTQETQIGTS